MKLYNIFLFKYLSVVKFSSQNNNLKYIFVRNNFQNFDLPGWLTGWFNRWNFRWSESVSQSKVQSSGWEMVVVVSCSSTNKLRAKNSKD